MADLKKKFTDMKVVELRQELDKLGLDKNGVKMVLVDRLMKHFEDQAKTENSTTNDMENSSFDPTDEDTEDNQDEGAEVFVEEVLDQNDDHDAGSYIGVYGEEDEEDYETEDSFINDTEDSVMINTEDSVVIENDEFEETGEEEETVVPNDDEEADNLDTEILSDAGADTQVIDDGNDDDKEPEADSEALDISVDESEQLAIDDDNKALVIGEKSETIDDGPAITDQSEDQGSADGDDNMDQSINTSSVNIEADQDSKTVEGENEETSKNKEAERHIILVTGLSSETSANDLKTHFRKYGKIGRIKIMTNTRVPGAQRFAHISVMSLDDLNSLVGKLNGAQLKGKNIRVSKEIRDEQRRREIERRKREEERERVAEMERQKRLEYQNYMEFKTLEREREKLRWEKERIEKEKQELIRMERERQKTEREKIEREKEELRRAKMNIEHHSHRSIPLKRPYEEEKERRRESVERKKPYALESERRARPEVKTEAERKMERERYERERLHGAHAASRSPHADGMRESRRDVWASEERERASRKEGGRSGERSHRRESESGKSSERRAREAPSRAAATPSDLVPRNALDSAHSSARGVATSSKRPTDRYEDSRATGRDDQWMQRSSYLPGSSLSLPMGSFTSTSRDSWPMNDRKIENWETARLPARTDQWISGAGATVGTSGRSSLPVIAPPPPMYSHQTAPLPLPGSGLGL